MNQSEQPRPTGSNFSSEARIGTGITIAGLGFLALMLAWAEKMRSEPQVAVGWLVAGALFMIVGLIVAASGKSKKS
jgi:dipeptide/tripeptide permease